MLENSIFEKIFNKESLHYSIYSKLAKHEKDREFRARLNNLVRLEKKHLGVWEDILRFYNKNPVQKRYSLYPNLFLLLRFFLGKSITASTLELYEASSAADFLNVINIVPSQKLDGVVAAITDELYNEKLRSESQTEKGILSHVREIVFGMNDGLVEVLASVAGIVGIYKSNIVAALAGLIIGISGTLSMSVGAYLSSRSEKDVSLSESMRLQLELEAARERAAKDLGKAYKSYKNLSRDLDNLIKKLKVAGDPFYKLLEKEKSNPFFRLMGRDKAVFSSGSSVPIKDAAYIGAFYLLGALIPLLSFFIGSVINDSVYLNLLISLLAASVAIVITAAMIAVNTNENVLKRAVQSLILSLAASGATFFIGSLVSSYLHVAV